MDDQATSTIEMVREKDVIISQPILNGRILPLATHELIEISATGPDGRLDALSRSLGRFKTESGSGKTFFGYRIELPDELRFDERRLYHRVLVGYDIAPEATLRTPKCMVPIHGVIEDLSAGGARMRCRNGAEHLQSGQYGYVHMKLPAPIGMVNALVRLCNVEVSALEHDVTVHLAFDTAIPELDAFIHSVDKRRSARIRRT
jgi:c-di-GMP-binding flagellar brake protein YcgR